MDTDTFWKIIDKAKAKSKGDPDEQVGSLREELAKLPAKEIAEFDRVMDQLMADSYRWDLWGAAYIINGGCSDDGFHYFRGWLISCGSKAFDAALKDPESLVKIANSEPEENENESFLCVAREAYEKKTGKGLPSSELALPSEPTGEQWDEEGDDLEKMFPKLWAKFNE